jgi:hypothetical protein
MDITWWMDVVWPFFGKVCFLGAIFMLPLAALLLALQGLAMFVGGIIGVVKRLRS